MSDSRFMSAQEKRRVVADWARFLESGFDPRLFTGRLYRHLTLHCSFIAHFDRAGFHGFYFSDPSATQGFLDQFDGTQGCRSVEYGDTGWIDAGDYRDVNGAMADEATARMPRLRRMLREREVAKARLELATAKTNLGRLLAEDDGIDGKEGPK